MCFEDQELTCSRSSQCNPVLEMNFNVNNNNSNNNNNNILVCIIYKPCHTSGTQKLTEIMLCCPAKPLAAQVSICIPEAS